MKRVTAKKLKSVRGSSIAEALVGFLICVLSVLALLAIATTTAELITHGDANIQVLYEEEGWMDTFVNEGELPAGAGGGMYIDYTPEGGIEQRYKIKVTGSDSSSVEINSEGEAAYYVTQRFHLFGFVPYASIED